MRILQLIFIGMLVAFTQSAQAQRAWDQVPAESFAGGSGTVFNPYLISNAAQFAHLLKATSEGEDFEGQYFELTNDIIFNGSVNQGKVFSGILDGKAHRIHGMNCYNSYTATCMFSTLNGTIKNLGLTGTRYGNKGFVGNVSQTGKIMNCYFVGRLNYDSGYDRYSPVYGLVGWNAGVVENCYVIASTNIINDYSNHPYRYMSSNSGKVSNCYSIINWENSYSWGNKITDFGNSSSVEGTENLTTDIDVLNQWVADHGSDYYVWQEDTNGPIMRNFNYTLNELYTVNFDPAGGTCSQTARQIYRGRLLGNLPSAESDESMEFIGWFFGKEQADETYPIYGNITLKAKWLRSIIEQPTTENPTIIVSNGTNAMYQWYKVSDRFQPLNLTAHSNGVYKWERGTNGIFVSTNTGVDDSSTSCEVPLSVSVGDVLNVDYSVDSESGYDEFSIIWNGKYILTKSGFKTNQSFEYIFDKDEIGTLKFVYSKDSSSNYGSDCVTIYNCNIGGQPEKLNCASSSFDFENVVDGDRVYCEVSYTNDDVILESDVITVSIPSPYKLYIEPMTIHKNRVNQVPVMMKNDNDVVTFQCDIELPEGLTIERDSHNEYAVVPSDRLDNSHQLLASDSDGKIRVVSYSSKNNSYSGNDGAVFYLPITITDEEATEFRININGASFTSDDLQMQTGPDTSVVLTVAQYEMGDANGDGLINATDIATLVAAVLGKAPSNFVMSASDINNDGMINATDIANLVSIILKGSQGGKRIKVSTISK